MTLGNLETEIKELNNRYHKLLFLCNRIKQFNTTIPVTETFKKINVNYVISEGLLNINQNHYPFHVESILRNVLNDKDKVYYLQHIDILFDPILKTHPIRMFENISKEYKLVVEWPGEFEEENLTYANHGHPEYFSCHDFQGKVIIK